jgi:cephalosporin hydroxylase
MAQPELPPAAQLVIDTYDPASGCYRREDGSLDPCPTEAETLGVWRDFVRCIKPKVIVETGVYQGLSTCFLASALVSNGNEDARIYSIDPWDTPHLWENSPLEKYIQFLAMTSQDAAPVISKLSIDLLVIDSIHTYGQSSWELKNFEPHVREGGFIIMHDSLFFDGVGRSAQHLYDNPRFEVITFDTPRTGLVETVKSGPVSMGCTIARKIRHGSPITQDPAWLNVPEAIPAGPDAFLRSRSREASGA